MKNMLDKMLSNPVGSAILFGTVTGGIAKIIQVVKGIPEVPACCITLSKSPTE